MIYNNDRGLFVAPMTAFNPDKEVEGCQRALSLCQAGPRVREIFRQFPDPGRDDDVAKADEVLTVYFEPQHAQSVIRGLQISTGKTRHV